MDQIKYRLTNKIINNIIDFEVRRKEIELMDLEDDVINELRLKARTEEIFHVANLFNTSITLKIAEKIASGKTTEYGDARIQYLLNFRNAIEFILANQNSYIPIEGNVLLHLNKILINSLAESWDAKFRDDKKLDLKSNDNWTKFANNSIDTSDIHPESVKVIDWFKEERNNISPLITIPITIYRLIRLFPFNIYNKLTFLAVAKMLFVKSGIDAIGQLSITKCFDKYEKDYMDTWEKAIKDEEDITNWLNIFSYTYSKEIYELLQQVNQTVEEHKEKKSEPFLDLNKRQLKILRYLQNIPKVKREEYVEMMDVSTMTAYRDLNKLVENSMLKVHGEGRGTYYTLVTR